MSKPDGTYAKFPARRPAFLAGLIAVLATLVAAGGCKSSPPSAAPAASPGRFASVAPALNVPSTINVANVAAMVARRGSVTQDRVLLAGYYTPGDGGGGLLWWDATGIDAADGGMTFAPTTGSSGRWRRTYAGGAADLRWWGVIADGMTNRHVRMQAALDSGVRHLRGFDNGLALRIGATLVIHSNTWLELDPGYVLQLAPGLSRGFVHIKNTTYFGTDHDIRISGGTWDCSGLAVDYANAIGQSPSRIAAGESGGLGARISMAGVTRLRIEGVTGVNSAVSGLGPSTIQVASCNEVVIKDVFLNATTSDGVHVNGPCRRLLIDNVWGSTTDDFIAIQAKDWLYGSPNHGLIEDVVIQNLYASSCGNFIKVTMSGDAPVRKLTIRDCRVDTGGMIEVFKDTDTYDPGNVFTVGTIEELTIDGFYKAGYNYRYIQVDHNVKGMRISKMPLSDAADGSQPLYIGPGLTVDDVEWIDLDTRATSSLAQVVWNNGGTIKHLRFAGGRYAGRSTVTFAPIVNLTNGGTIEHLVVDGMTIDAPLGRVFSFAAGTTVNDMALIGVTATQTASGNPSFIESAGTLRRLKVAGGRYVGGQCFLRSTGTSAAIDVASNGVHFDGQTHVYLNAGVAATLRFTGCTFDNLPGGVVTNYDFDDGDSSTASSTVFSTGCTLTAASVGLGGVAAKKPGGGSLRWVGHDVAQDLTVLTPVKWDTAQSLTTATGPAIYTGSAWALWGHP
jgi:hypothetical protein